MTRSTKPYLARALWEWCEDNGLTALLHVLVEGTGAHVPHAFVKEGQIILNVSTAATRQLTMDNSGIEFTARFNGVTERVTVPWRAVLGLFARETGEGMAFPPDEQEWTEEQTVVDGKDGASSPLVIASDSGGSDETSQQPRKKPTLTVIK